MSTALGPFCVNKVASQAMLKQQRFRPGCCPDLVLWWVPFLQHHQATVAQAAVLHEVRPAWLPASLQK